MGILAWVLWGLIVGMIARLIVPVGRRLGCFGTILLGVMGSFVGGMIGSLIADDGLEVTSSGFIGSTIGAVVILVIIRVVDSGSEH